VQQLDPEQEQILVDQARTQPEAFRTLYNAYFPRVYAYVAYRVARVEDAEDLVSDIFLKSVERFHQFESRGIGSFAAWLFRIAHNQVQDFYRRHRRLDDQLQLEALLNLQDSAPQPDAVLVQKEQFAHLRRLISTLSPRRQEVISLKFFGRLRNREIADILGLDERAVASHLCRALEDLHQKYTDSQIWESEGNQDERTR
jgi:RNA polymerase sigma-70 factor (ECF subfamily)